MVEDPRALGEQECQVADAFEHRAIEAKLGGRRRGFEAMAGDHHRAQSFTQPGRRIDAVPQAVESGVHAAELVNETMAVSVGCKPYPAPGKWLDVFDRPTSPIGDQRNEGVVKCVELSIHERPLVVGEWAVG